MGGHVREGAAPAAATGGVSTKLLTAGVARSGPWKVRQNPPVRLATSRIALICQPVPTQEYDFASAQLLTTSFESRAPFDQSCILQTFELMPDELKFSAGSVGHGSVIDGPRHLSAGPKDSLGSASDRGR